MKIYANGRQTGKTTQLVRWLGVHPDGVLVVYSAQERDRILKEYINVDPDRIKTIAAVLEGKLRGRNPRPIIAIDNLDLILPQIMGGTIGPVTLTPEEE